MKVATFNINNVNRRLPNLLAWLKSAKPDIACLQELKSTDADFPVDAIGKAGYRAWRGQKTWNGVAILSRGAEPIITRAALPGDPEDNQSRYIEAAIDGVLVGCIYLPKLSKEWCRKRDSYPTPSLRIRRSTLINPMRFCFSPGGHLHGYTADRRCGQEADAFALAEMLRRAGIA